MRFFPKLGSILRGPKSQLPEPSFSFDDVARIFAEALQSARSDILSVERKSNDELMINFSDGDSATFFLGNLRGQINAEPSAASETLERYVKTVSQARERTGCRAAEFSRSALIPIIRNSEYIDHLREVAAASSVVDEEYFFRHLAADYWILIAIDSEAAITPLRRSMLSADEDFESISKDAIENFKSRIMPGLKANNLDDIRMLVGSGDFESSMLAIDSFWNDASAEFGDRVLAVALSKDVLLFCPKSNLGTVGRLKGIVEERGGTFPYAISTQILEWDGNGWVILTH